MGKKQVNHFYEVVKPVFNIPRQIDVSLHIKLILETVNTKLFEHIGEDGANPAAIYINRPKLRVTFFETPTINFCLYQFNPQFSNTISFTLSQMRDYRTDVEVNFFEKQMVIRQNRFGGNKSFENANMQFDGTIISIQPETSSKHRNTFACYNNKQANHLIKRWSPIKRTERMIKKVESCIRGTSYERWERIKIEKYMKF